MLISWLTGLQHFVLPFGEMAMLHANSIASPPLCCLSGSICASEMLCFLLIFLKICLLRPPTHTRTLPQVSHSLDGGSFSLTSLCIFPRHTPHDGAWTGSIPWPWWLEREGLQVRRQTPQVLWSSIEVWFKLYCVKWYFHEKKNRTKVRER